MGASIRKMKITPIEIRQKSFEKKMRGYDKEEVSAFLQSLSNEWERVLDETKELKIKLDLAQKEVSKLREVESSLFKTLKTAEDTGASLVDQANRAAQLHLKETQMNAEAMLNEAKSRAKNMIERAEMEARNVIEEMQDAVKDLEQNYRALEVHRDNVIADLKTLSEDLVERINRTAKQKNKFSFEDHSKKVKAIVRESEKRLDRENVHVELATQKPLEKPAPPVAAAPEPVKKPEPAPVRIPEKESRPVKEVATQTKDGSFFDQIGD